MLKRSEKLIEEGLVPFEQSMETAKFLFAAHGEEINEIDCAGGSSENNLLTDEDRNAIMFGGTAIRYFFKKFPDKVLERFSGHGITRKAQIENLASFINILQNGAIQGDSASLKNSGYYNAIIETDFFIISHLDKPLKKFTNLENMQPERNSVGWLVNAGAFIVNAKFYPVVDDLRTMFPGVNIIKANEISNYINQELEEPKK